MNKSQFFFLLLLLSFFKIQAQTTISFNNTIDYQAAYPAAITAFQINPAVSFACEQKIHPVMTIDCGYRFGAGLGYGKLFSTVMLTDSVQFRLPDNQPIIIAKKKRGFHLPVIHSWSLKNIICAVCDYMNKGVSAKYQPATLFIADTRSVTR